jgi:hypothetical protein
MTLLAKPDCNSFLVMPGRSMSALRRLRKLVCDPGHPRLGRNKRRTWMAGTGPAMTA